MSTSYELVFNKFIKKLKNDDQFLNYKGLTDDEVEEMVNDHLNTLLDRSIDKIYQYGLPDVNLYDKDDESLQFNIELVPQEISLLSDLMYFCYQEEERNKLKAFEITFRSNELNLFSPSNERRTFLSMLEGIEENVVNSISNYYSRDRLTWKIKSIYQSSETS